MCVSEGFDPQKLQHVFCFPDSETASAHLSLSITPSSVGLKWRQFTLQEKNNNATLSKLFCQDETGVIVIGFSFGVPHTIEPLKVDRGVVVEWSDKTGWELLCVCVCLYRWMQMPSWSICLLICVDECVLAQRLIGTSHTLLIPHTLAFIQDNLANKILWFNMFQCSEPVSTWIFHCTLSSWWVQSECR